MDERNNFGADGESPNEELPTRMDETLPQFYGTAKDFVSRYTHCVLCGANLHFTHITDFSKNLTQESARCLECGVKARNVIHRLQ